MQCSFLATASLLTATIGEQLNCRCKASILRNICPHAEWLNDPNFLHCLEAAGGISHTTYFRSLQPRNNGLSHLRQYNWIRQYGQAKFEKSGVLEVIPRTSFVLSRNPQIVNLYLQNDEPLCREYSRGRPPRPTLEEIRESIANLPRLRPLGNWLEDAAPVISGSHGIRRLVFGNWKQSYHNYGLYLRSRNVPLISEANFRKTLRDWNIRPADYSRYVCPICTLDQGNPIREQHEALKARLSALYRAEKDMRERGDVFIIADFARIHECRPEMVERVDFRDGKLARYNDSTTLSDLCFAVWMDRESKPRYLDFFGQVNQGAAYLRYSLERLCVFLSRTHERVRRITVYTDGGFQNYRMAFFWGIFLEHFPNSTLNIRYFAPYHGHAAADSHFGAGKMSIRKNNVHIGLVSPDDAKSEFAKLPNTVIRNVPSDLPPSAIKFKQWSPGIKSWHYLNYTKIQGEVLIKTRGHVNYPSLQSEFLMKASKDPLNELQGYNEMDIDSSQVDSVPQAAESSETVPSSIEHSVPVSNDSDYDASSTYYDLEGTVYHTLMGNFSGMSRDQVRSIVKNKNNELRRHAETIAAMDNGMAVQTYLMSILSDQREIMKIYTLWSQQNEYDSIARMIEAELLLAKSATVQFHK